MQSIFQFNNMDRDFLFTILIIDTSNLLNLVTLTTYSKNIRPQSF